MLLSTPALDRTKWFLFHNFERILVVLLAATMLLVHFFVERQLAFLSFYYLPVIAAGFFLGRNPAVLAAIFIVSLVIFLHAVAGIDGPPGADAALLTIVPWGGFLIMTGFVVGSLAQDRQNRLDDLKSSNIAMLDLLAFHMESSEKQLGHSHRVAERAVALGVQLGMDRGAQEDLRVAALLHELDAHDPRLARLLARFPGQLSELPFAGSMRTAMEVAKEYGRYHSEVGDDWPVDQIRMSLGAKVLAVADAFETLQTPTPTRAALPPWSAFEEIERGAGRIFGSEVVQALRTLAAQAPRQDADVRLTLVSGTQTGT